MRVKAYRIARALEKIVCFRIRRGFGPAAEVLLFRQKGPKPFWPCHGPSGALRGSPTPSALLRTGPAACKLAELVLRCVEGLKQCSPFSRCRLHCLAMPPGQEIQMKENEDGSPITTVGDDGGGWQTNSPGSHKATS